MQETGGSPGHLLSAAAVMVALLATLAPMQALASNGSSLTVACPPLILKGHASDAWIAVLHPGNTDVEVTGIAQVGAGIEVALSHILSRSTGDGFTVDIYRLPLQDLPSGATILIIASSNGEAAMCSTVVIDAARLYEEASSVTTEKAGPLIAAAVANQTSGVVNAAKISLLTKLEELASTEAQIGENLTRVEEKVEEARQTVVQASNRLREVSDKLNRNIEELASVNDALAYASAALAVMAILGLTVAGTAGREKLIIVPMLLLGLAVIGLLLYNIMRGGP